LPNASSALRPLLAAPAALLLSQEQAKAVLTYNFFESAGNVVVQTSGSLDLTGATPLPAGEGCGPAAFDSDVAVLCTGVKNNYDGYVISGPSALDGNGNLQFASSVSGINIIIIGVVKETLENPGHPRENAAVIAGADWVHGQQAARIWRLRAGHG
jgi:hypothetical protein